MTPDEYDQKLQSLSKDGYAQFANTFGGGQQTAELRVKQFGHERKHEELICFLLELKTEDEKRTEAQVTAAKAALESAETAKEAANTAKSSLYIAFVAVLITTVMAVVATSAYLNKAG